MKISRRRLRRGFSAIYLAEDAKAQRTPREEKREGVVFESLSFLSFSCFEKQVEEARFGKYAPPLPSSLRVLCAFAREIASKVFTLTC
jgi:hypothetical protein